MFSPAYYGACTAGVRILLTHMTVTPLDLVKCNMQLMLQDLAGPENAIKYKTFIYLAGSASAELIADVALCPFEAVKGRRRWRALQGTCSTLGKTDSIPMMKFATFETIVKNLFKYAIPTPKDQCTKGFQLGVSFVGGYVAGVFCAIVSHPADNLVSFLNNATGATVGDAVNKLGVMGLCTRGLPLRIVMIGTLTGAQWGSYDAFKVFVGLPTTGGAAPAAVAPVSK
ncbi:mitochondrial carrier protein [Lithospermum erythrorhizon]|uniref:Mitochondrial carrier protein n=1 Tax=Lithospermum erythrorhizon TaxID=34254 RepID=A0AAV3RRD7_LITER